MILIITPVYKAFEKVKEMCAAIDRGVTQPYFHVLVADNCGDIPVANTQNRAVISVRNDFIANEHKSREGQMLDLAFQLGTQKTTPYGNQPKIDHVFLIESDVMVPEGFDKAQIALSDKLANWATLDCISIDPETGKPGYPTVISPRYEIVDIAGSTFDHQHYADFQCTLFNNKVWETGVRFSDFPDHFDILWSRKITELTGRQHYRGHELEVIHYASSSRSELPNQ